MEFYEVSSEFKEAFDNLDKEITDQELKVIRIDTMRDLAKTALSSAGLNSEESIDNFISELIGMDYLKEDKDRKFYTIEPCSE